MTPTKVLVVEDDPSVRGLLQSLLAAEGYDVSTASDGLAALRTAGSTQPALILLDLQLPDLGGARVIEQLRVDPDLAATPVVVVTGMVEEVPDVEALLGAASVFVKPFEVADLLERVGQLTGGPTP